MDPATDPNVTDPNVQVSDGADPNVLAQQKLGWRAELPDTLKEHEAFKDYATKNDLWKSHIDLREKAKGYEGQLANAILKPGEKATDEEKTAYRQSLYKELGVPDKPEDYKFTKPEIPEGMPYDDAVEAWFKTAMHNRHVSPEDANGFFNDYISMTAQYFQEASKLQKEATQTKMNDVKKAWGTDAAVNSDLATRAIKVLADLHKDIPGYAEWITQAAFEKSPFMYVMLADIGKANQNSPFIQGEGSGDSRSLNDKAKDFYKT